MKNVRINAIPKASFPSLLKTCLCQMNDIKPRNSLSRDLKSAFKATGIFPIDRNSVLNKLPRSVDTDTVNDILTDYLKNQRFDNSDSQSRRKRKKIIVPPGSSITSAVLRLNNADHSSDDEDDNGLPILNDESEKDENEENGEKDENKEKYENCENG